MNSYLDRMPKHQPSKETLDKKAFDEEMNKTAEKIVDMLPEMLTELIDINAAVLFDQMPECMKGEDPVSHVVINEKHIRRMLAGKVGNKIGKGMSFLQK
ncbi:TPA: hypothetical protein OHP72_000711 [Escherichia coli]|nr:hypothetical protein [Escherichia coli]